MIAQPEAWLDRWPHLVEVQRTSPPDAWPSFEARVRGPAGYALAARVTTTHLAPPDDAHMELAGDLVGDAWWELAADGAGTRVELLMDVQATPAWMVALAPVARPLFAWSHRRVVRHAVEAATDHLGADLLRFDSRPDPPPP